jgi:hypothetical protein
MAREVRSVVSEVIDEPGLAKGFIGSIAIITSIASIALRVTVGVGDVVGSEVIFNLLVLV